MISDVSIELKKKYNVELKKTNYQFQKNADKGEESYEIYMD